MSRTYLFALSAVLSFFTAEAMACSPTGAINYISGTQKVQYCDGTSWIELGIEGSIGGPPTGGVIAVATSSCPTGYLPANGSAVSRTTYASLFTAIGVMYGNGDGSTTFNVPDYRGRFLRSLNGGSGVDPDAASRTNRGDGTTGDNVGTLQASSNSAHTHGPGTLTAANTNTTGNHSHTVNLSRNNNSKGGGGSYQVVTSGSTITLGSSTSGSHSHTANVTSGSTGSSGSTETRPINIAVLFCIKS